MISLLNLRQIVAAALCMATMGELGHAAELLTGIAAAKPENAGEIRTVTMAGDWQVQCNESAGSINCRMSTVGSATNAAGGAVTVQLASEARSGGGQLFFFLTPLDLLVARGVEMRIDGGGAQNLPTVRATSRVASSLSGSPVDLKTASAGGRSLRFACSTSTASRSISKCR